LDGGVAKNVQGFCRGKDSTRPSWRCPRFGSQRFRNGSARRPAGPPGNAGKTEPIGRDGQVSKVMIAECSSAETLDRAAVLEDVASPAGHTAILIAEELQCDNSA